MPHLPFASTPEELTDSVLTFSAAPSAQQREVIGSNPIYFAHVVEGGKHHFGLSKFVAFRDVSIQDYIDKERNTTSGGDTRKHIARVTGQEWTPLGEATDAVRTAFLRWFERLPGNPLRSDQIRLLTLDRSHTVRRKKRSLSPEELQRRLAEQAETGRIGEDIAVKHEWERLRLSGYNKSTAKVLHVAKDNAAAGYDIRSVCEGEVRCIEVKATVGKVGRFFISRGELEAMRTGGSEAYLYLVKIDSKEHETGKVVREIRNPYGALNSEEVLNPVLYEAVLDVED